MTKKRKAEFKGKVFCKDCQFLRREKTIVGVGQVAEAGVCISVTNITPRWYGLHHEYSINPSQQNKDNDCKLYKQKSGIKRFFRKMPPVLKKRI